MLAGVDECDGPITTAVRVAFERSYGGNRRVVGVGGIGGSNGSGSNGNVIEHAHKHTGLQAERRDVLCKAKRLEDQSVSSSFFMSDSNVREIIQVRRHLSKPKKSDRIRQQRANSAQCLDAKTAFPRWIKSAGARESIGSGHTEFAYGKCRVKRTKREGAGSCGGEGDFCELTHVFPGVLFNTED
jgi:hypothetical protein